MVPLFPDESLLREPGLKRLRAIPAASSGGRGTQIVDVEVRLSYGVSASPICAAANAHWSASSAIRSSVGR